MTKKVTVFDNYSNYSIDNEDLVAQATEICEENGIEASTSNIRDLIDDLERQDFENARHELATYFDDKLVMMTGTVGTWRGNCAGGLIGVFSDLFNKAIEDCAYINVYDERGHLYIECSHHDGTNHFEIHILSNAGNEYVERNGLDYVKCNEEVHEKFLRSRTYIRLPHFAKNVYGC